MAANERQVGGSHYRKSTGVCPHCGGTVQHWDLFAELPYLVGQVSKYVMREKNGLEDYEKAAHFLQKLVETRYPEVRVTIQFDHGSQGKASRSVRKK